MAFFFAVEAAQLHKKESTMSERKRKKEHGSTTLLQNLALIEFQLLLQGIFMNLFNGYSNVRSSLWRFQIAPSEKRQQKKDPDEDQVCLLLGICKKDDFKMLCKSYC